MMNEIERLHNLGFALHWLRPKSKAPIESKWSQGPRKTLDELKRTYKPGMNLGVRLGIASKVNNAYLAVIDCDVKSTRLESQLTLDLKLKEIFGDKLTGSPKVISGRGNGSRHYYVLTKKPVSPQRLSQSSDKVKVLMPSVKPSKSDISSLSTEELEAGYRMRAAWEISLMGEGQQVVLPPSVHPDSGREYMWAVPLKSEDDLSVIAIGEAEVISETRVLNDFEMVEVDLPSKNLSPRIMEILRGETEDRSAGLFSIAMAMCGKGMTDNEILSVLSDTQYEIARAAYDRRGSSRAAAVDWLREYVLKKARTLTDETKCFNEAVEVSEMSLSEILEQNKELEDELDKSEKGKLKCSFKNLIKILNKISESVFKHDEFSNAEVYGVDTPWGGVKGQEIRNIDLINMKQWFAVEHKIEPHINLICEAMQFVAYKNSYHPVRNYIRGLPEWDGVERLDTWMVRLLNAKGPEIYVKAVSRKLLVAMIKRVFVPGCKFDYVPVLIGAQGILKSTAVARLGAPWSSDAHMNISDKDGVLAMRGAWLMELGELSSLSKAETNQVKEFVTRATDRIRTPYGKLTEAFPRQCVFIGTTNNDEFLKDETGNRRFWPIEVGVCDVDALSKERNQLFAEAYLIYGLGEELYLDEKEAQIGAESEQEKRLESDILVDRVSEFFAKETPNFNAEKFTLFEAFGDWGPFKLMRDDMVTHRRAGRALKMAGFEKRAAKGEDKKWRKYWFKKIDP